MNATTMEARTSGDEGSVPEPDSQPWPTADGLPEDHEAPDEFDARAEATATTASAPEPAVRCSDQQLVEWIDAIVDQNERALAALYDATFARVFGLVQRIVRRTALAEEVVEDTYFQVWRQAVRFDPARGRALTWLLAMARTRAIDALRREARFRHESLDDDAQPDTPGEHRASDELLDLAKHQSDLHQALMLLGAQPRQLVSLAFFRGLSHEEIAQQMELPLGTVKSQIRRALLSMRQIIGDGAVRAAAPPFTGFRTIPS